MKMNKLKIELTSFLIGAIIFSGISVAAVTLTAAEIKYTPSNNKFTATNVQEAMDEIYKLTEYEVPVDTYFYNSATSGENIVRYKKVDGKYYLCDKNGKVTTEDEQDVSNLTLIEYSTIEQNNVSYGKAGYADNNIVLGSNSDKMIVPQLYIDSLQGNTSFVPGYLLFSNINGNKIKKITIDSIRGGSSNWSSNAYIYIVKNNVETAIYSATFSGTSKNNVVVNINDDYDYIKIYGQCRAGNEIIFNNIVLE